MDVDLDRTQLAEVHGDIEVAIDAVQLALEEGVELIVTNACDVDGADGGEGDVAGAVDSEVGLLVDLSEELDAELVARADHVIGCDGDVFDMSEGVGDIVE